jgi:hypothetical protein
VIVRCPSCGTHYHHQPVGAAASGRCSRCEDTVPLVAAKRLFVLRALEPVLRPAGVSIGMDASPAGSPEEMTYRIASAFPESDARRLKKVVTGEIRAAEADHAEIRAAEPSIGLPAGAAAEQSEAGPVRNSLRETLVAMLMTSLGTVTAYYLCLEQGLDPVLWMFAGAGWGLVFGWICIRWMRRGR